MPWSERTVVSEREEFVRRGRQEGANISALCREYGISRKTGYKLLRRFEEEGAAGLKDRSHRPRQSPGRSAEAVVSAVLRVRDAHPAWGPRKIRRVLEREGRTDLPSPSTISAILRRNGCIDPEQARKHRPWQRFEREAPNELWQMDFKGHFALEDERRCHPLTLLDDHSRFNLGLRACADQQTRTVQQELVRIFSAYGLPEAILADNGPPWGSAGSQTRYTPLSVWLVRLGIRLLHGRPYHPQTQGKEERFHRTLAAEALRDFRAPSYAHCQERFDCFRACYNHERPHEAIGMQVPAERYTCSPRRMPERLPPIEYPAGIRVRTVQVDGRISFRGGSYRVPKAFAGLPVAVQETGTEGEFSVFFCQQPIATLDLHHCRARPSPEPGL